MSIPASPQPAARLLGLWHLASLDAPTVAVIWSLALARTAAVHLPVWTPLLLALATWAVYVGDRLLDTRRALRSGDLRTLRERHWFHWRHRRLLLPAAVAAALVCAALLCTAMPAPFRARNSILAAAALAYFSGVHLPRNPRRPTFVKPALLSKELLVGLLFAAGCALPTLLRAHPAPRAAALVAAAYLALLAWLNCHAIDRWESARDARIFPKACAVALLALPLAHFVPAAAPLFAAASASALLLAALHRLRARLAPLTLRACADLALLAPLALLR